MRNLRHVISIDELLDEARGFLDAHLEPRAESDEKFVWGEGSDRVNILEETEASELTTTLAAAKRYAAARFDAGFGWIDGPVEYGGRGLSLDHARAYQELEGELRRCPTSRSSPSRSGSSGPRSSRARRPSSSARSTCRSCTAATS